MFEKKKRKIQELEGKIRELESEIQDLLPRKSNFNKTIKYLDSDTRGAS